MLGTFIGDSLGAGLEFRQDDIAEEELDNALNMVAPHSYSLNPGHVTDDTEMSMCQMKGLLAGKGQFDLFQISLCYGQWVASGPTDMGTTTRNGLSILAENLDNPDPNLAHTAAF